MKISEEIKKLKNKIEPLIDDHVEWLMISFEFSENGKWHATPQYEGGGDGRATYIEVEGKTDGILQGAGDTLPAAIRNLNINIDNIIKDNLSLYRWC